MIVALSPGATDTPAPPAKPPAEEEASPPLSTEYKGFVTAQLLGTEVVFITVAGVGDTCASVVDRKAMPPKGAQRAELKVLWLTGYYDFSNRMAEGKLSTSQGNFWLKEAATQGGIQVRAAPMKVGETGRIHLEAARPGSAQSMDVEVTVEVCAPLDFTRKGKK